MNRSPVTPLTTLKGEEEEEEGMCKEEGAVREMSFYYQVAWCPCV